jgi:2-oxoglutarate dehydrogenase E2 component (dihydrolipoamide succinyltransferase)
MSDVVHIKASQLNPNDEGVTIVELAVQQGALVSKGDLIVTVETSKATEEVCAPASGYLAFRHPVGAFVRAGDDIAAIYPSLAALSSAQPGKELSLTSAPEQSQDGTSRATRKAVELAGRLGIDLSAFSKQGIIREDDVRRYAAAQTTEDNTGVALSREDKASVNAGGEPK